MRNSNMNKPNDFWGGFKWYFHLTLLAILPIGILLFTIPFPAYEGISKVFNLINPSDLLDVIGIICIYFVLSHYLSFIIHQLISRQFEISNESAKADLSAPIFLGFFESILYIIILLFNLSYVLIGTYITLKVIGQWVGWGGNNRNNYKYSFLEAKRGRRRFNRFLIGNILRVILAAIAYLIIKGFYFTSY